MIVLGLNHGELNSSAALYKDGRIVAGGAEERFNRQKKSKAFPHQAIRYCLDEAGIELGDCDFVAQAWNPYANLSKYNPFISSFRSRREDYFYSVPDNLLNLADERAPRDWAVTHFQDDYLPPVYYVQHHRTHAANSMFLSPFRQAAILTADWKGEFESATMGFGDGNRIEVLDTMSMPHSLGMFYSTFTELLGYRSDSDEWKVMALSAFDVEYEKEYRAIHSTIELTDDGFFEMDQTCYKGALLDQPDLYTDKLRELLGGRVGTRGETADEWHMRIACAMQQVAEEIAEHMLLALYERTRSKNLVLGGGFFMNSVFNGKITSRTPFENVFVPYAPTDAGNSIGAALYVAHHIHGDERRFGFNPSQIGNDNSPDRIEAALNRRRIAFERLDDRDEAIAELLADGQIVAVCNGRMEFGERALGNRSILADPRTAEVKDRINAIIKYRESYRPFAPVTLQSEVSTYFDVDHDFTSHYMEQVVMVKDEHRDRLQAVVHVDGSGRVQTIDDETNPDFCNIIRAFARRTGLPVVLNTSFNINGEPIVSSPDDALSTFFNSGLEHLVMGDYYVRKQR